VITLVSQLDIITVKPLTTWLSKDNGIHLICPLDPPQPSSLSFSSPLSCSLYFLNLSAILFKFPVSVTVENDASYVCLHLEI
jgi:hypothetical protein